MDAFVAVASLVGVLAVLLALLLLARDTSWSKKSISPAGAWRPKVTVIVPCRGEHPGLEENIRAMLTQDYPAQAHEVLLVVDDADDVCVPPLRRAILGKSHARLLIALPPLPEGGTGKIRAMLSGVAEANPASAVLVFADADARPAPPWLASLVAPLEDKAIGGVTGFQIYRAATRPSLTTLLRDAFMSQALAAMFSDKSRFLWGGSMALRRADFEGSGLREAWRTAVADDAAMTAALKKMGLRIVFAPGALVASPEDWSPSELRAWVAKEVALIIAVTPGLVRLVTLVNVVSALAPLAGLALLASGRSGHDVLVQLAGIALLFPALLAPVRAWLRSSIAARATGAEGPGRGERAMQALLSLAMPWLTLRGILRARRLRAIDWRGRTYALPAGAPAEGADGERR